MKLIAKITLLILLAVAFHGCNKLPLQESFDFDENDHPSVKPRFNMSIYDFMLAHAEFSLMVEAVKRAGMENLFSGGADDKTVLMLRNEAMTEFLTNHRYAKISDVPVATLQNLLNYHVIKARITQNDLTVQDFTVFQTMIDGANGKITLYKWREYWEIQINTGGPDLPSTAKKANVYLHNYEFTNGVGHHMKQYVRRVPF